MPWRGLGRLVVVLLSTWAALAGDALAAAEPSVAKATFAVVDQQAGEWPIPEEHNARDPVIDAQGRVVFGLTRSDRIARFDPKDQRIQTWKVASGTHPHGIVIARDGSIFFGGHANATLNEINPDTGWMRVHQFASPASKPYTLKLDAKGDVWATLRGADRIARLERATGLIQEFPVPSEPYDLAVDAQGIIWVSCIGADRLVAFDPVSNQLTSLETGKGSKPRRIALGRNGVVWVTLYGSGMLLKVDSATRRKLAEYPMPGGQNAGPYSVHVDSTGQVWVNEFQTDAVLQFNPVTERFRVVKMLERDSRVRNSILDSSGRLWYLSPSRGRLGVVSP